MFTKNNQKNRILIISIFIITLILIPTVWADDFVPDTEETAVNTLMLDNDDTGGDVILQFGQTLAEQIKWNSVSLSFEMSDDLQIVGDFFQTGSTLTIDSDDTGGDATIKFGATSNHILGWDVSETSFSTFNSELSMRVKQGSAPPFACTSTVEGMLWTDTDTGIVYSCDASNSRNKWLSIESTSLFGDESGGCSAGRDPNNNANCNVDWGNGLGPDGSTLLGLYIPYNMTITGYGFSEDNDACTSGSFDVEVWGTGSNANDNDYSLDAEVATGLTGEAHNSNTLNIDIDGDQYILWGLDNNCGQTIDDWNVILYFKWRHA